MTEYSKRCHDEEGNNLTPASTAIGLPRWSSSDSSSSMLLLINDVILGILALITDSKCWKKIMNNISSNPITVRT